MATIYTQENRRPAYRDVSGTDTMPRSPDTVDKITIDWSDLLDSTETISSATWTVSGVTVNGETISGQTTYAAVTGSNGDVTVEIATSLARTLAKTMQFVAV